MNTFKAKQDRSPSLDGVSTELGQYTRHVDQAEEGGPGHMCSTDGPGDTLHEQVRVPKAGGWDSTHRKHPEQAYPYRWGAEERPLGWADGEEWGVRTGAEVSSGEEASPQSGNGDVCTGHH